MTEARVGAADGWAKLCAPMWARSKDRGGHVMARSVAQSRPWYVAIQLRAAAALPLSVRFFDLPRLLLRQDTGRLSGGRDAVVGSYGLLRNEFGGAMIALGAVTAVSYGFGGYRALRRLETGLRGRGQADVASVRRSLWPLAGRLGAPHDPAANHTEQPMDLMFMNSIWSSPTIRR